jgi:Tfp pilus assembly PilM family ATPase
VSLFSKLVSARLPPAAVGLSGDGAGVVQLERRRDSFAVRRAGFLPLAPGVLAPGFDAPNVADAGELARSLAELAEVTGLQKRRRWSVALPEAATRTAIVTMESAPASKQEGEEMLRWKTERAVGAPAGELRSSRERLPPDAQGRARYLVTAVRLEVLEGYEAVFASLGWQAGLILPRHLGEAWWLARDRAAEDSLLVSSHPEGFTAVIMRGGQPLYVRAVACEAEDCADELYRFLLFYRDRTSPPAEEGEAAPPPAADTIARLLVAGTGIGQEEASAVVAETLGIAPRAVRAEDVRLSFPSEQLDFRQIAAPAGLAALAFA